MQLNVPSFRVLVILAACLVLPASVVVRAQDAQQSEATLRAALAQQPTNAAAYLDLAKLYIEQGRLDDAVMMITNALAITRQQAGMPSRARQEAQTTGDSPVRIGGDIGPPRKLTHVDPVYPAEAQAARVQGVVIVEAIIDQQGNVVKTQVLRSVPMLDAAAVDAVSQWKFTPTLLNGVPTSVVMTMTVNFSLN